MEDINKLPVCVSDELAAKINPLIEVNMHAPIVGNVLSVDAVSIDKTDGMTRIAMTPHGVDGVVFRRLDGAQMQAMVNVTPDGDEEQQVSAVFTGHSQDLSLVRHGDTWYFDHEISDINDEQAAQKFAAILFVNAVRKQRETAKPKTSVSSVATGIGRVVRSILPFTEVR